MRQQIINKLVEIWRQMIEDGEFDAEEMRQSLEEQAYGGCQGWDNSLEELECHPELGEMLGYDEDLTDEQFDQWQEIVIEAARRYLDEVV